MRGKVLIVAAIGTLAAPGAASAATTVAGMWQGAEAQVRVSQSPNGAFLGDVAAATTIAGCPVAKDHTLWIIDSTSPVHGRSAKVYDATCADSFSTATFQVLDDGTSDWLRVCVAEPGSEAVPTSTAPAGTLPSGLGVTGCADLKRVLGFSGADGPAHTAGDYIKKIRRGRCVLRFGPTSFFTRIAQVADDPAVKVRMIVNGRSAETGQVSGNEYRFDMKARKGENVVKVIVRTFDGKVYKKTKKLTC
jgi:hypothetical protein